MAGSGRPRPKGAGLGNTETLVTGEEDLPNPGVPNLQFNTVWK